MPGFEDRTVSLDAPEQLADLGAALGSRTRLAVLATLVRSHEPLHINEVARRVGVDASPVRGHLEVLVKEGLAREIDSPTGRERRFEAALDNVVVTLQGAHKPRMPKELQKPKAVVRLEKKLSLMERDISRIQEKARKVQAEIIEAWKEAVPAKPKA